MKFFQGKIKKVSLKRFFFTLFLISLSHCSVCSSSTARTGNQAPKTNQTMTAKEVKNLLKMVSNFDQRWTESNHLIPKKVLEAFISFTEKLSFVQLKDWEESVVIRVRSSHNESILFSHLIKNLSLSSNQKKALYACLIRYFKARNSILKASTKSQRSDSAKKYAFRMAIQQYYTMLD